MDETRRLELIVEAVKYCKHARDVGMPSAGYTKALREAVHFLWERRIGARVGRISGPKICAAKFRSEESKGLSFGKGKLNYDHALPFKKYVQDKLLGLANVTTASVRRVLEDSCVPALITQEEHKRLSQAGLRDRMPDCWNRTNPLARYKKVRIEMDDNEFYFDCAAARRQGKAKA